MNLNNMNPPTPIVHTSRNWDDPRTPQPTTSSAATTTQRDNPRIKAENVQMPIPKKVVPPSGQLYVLNEFQHVLQVKETIQKLIEELQKDKEINIKQQQENIILRREITRLKLEQNKLRLAIANKGL